MKAERSVVFVFVLCAACLIVCLIKDFPGAWKYTAPHREPYVAYLSRTTTQEALIIEPALYLAASLAVLGYIALFYEFKPTWLVQRSVKGAAIFNSLGFVIALIFSDPIVRYALRTALLGGYSLSVKQAFEQEHQQEKEASEDDDSKIESKSLFNLLICSHPENFQVHKLMRDDQ